MSSVQDRIMAAFKAKLSKLGSVTPASASAICELLKPGNKPKVEEVVSALMVEPTSGPLP
jgi:hypothetical protein